jgi:hypothetical protein
MGITHTALARALLLQCPLLHMYTTLFLQYRCVMVVQLLCGKLKVWGGNELLAKDRSKVCGSKDLLLRCAVASNCSCLVSPPHCKRGGGATDTRLLYCKHASS